MDRLLESALELAKQSPFYASKWAQKSFTKWDEIPFTSKADLVRDQEQHPPYGSNLTRPIDEYVRVHQTSGTTTGRPLRWMDTPSSWNWLLQRWDIIYRHVGLQPDDRLLFAFSFGPFLGFWTAFESATKNGWAVFPAGGMTTTARLRYLLDHRITIISCTPTYALHLAEVAQKECISLADSSVRGLIVAGEPGGLIPATRARIESAWGARVFDHYGLTEVGPVAVEPTDDRSAMIIVEGFHAEVIDPATWQPVADGQIGELVLTNLGRAACPLIRYRTGDLVRAATSSGQMRLVGGILGRSDDMVHIRGNNVYPSAIEGVMRRFSEIAEYRVTVDETGPLTDLLIEIESVESATPSALIKQVELVMRDELLFRPTVVSVSSGTLPRFEMKAQRFQRRRS